MRYRYGPGWIGAIRISVVLFMLPILAGAAAMLWVNRVLGWTGFSELGVYFGVFIAIFAAQFALMIWHARWTARKEERMAK